MKEMTEIDVKEFKMTPVARASRAYRSRVKEVEEEKDAYERKLRRDCQVVRSLCKKYDWELPCNLPVLEPKKRGKYATERARYVKKQEE